MPTPTPSAKLKADIQKVGLQPSPRIRDRLEHYRSIIPMSNEAFVEHAVQFIGHMPKEGKHPDYGEGWYHDRLPAYNESHGEAAQQALDEIIQTYF